jgi:two-component system, NtrC family, sensor kinase
MATALQKEHTVLYVDDDEKTLVLMGEIFSSEDYKIITINSGEKALSYIKENELVSVVISDFKMKGMNGLELLQQVKTLSPNTKRYLCSGSFDKGTLKTKVENQEIHGFMVKPINISQMLTIISGYVKDVNEKVVHLPLEESTETETNINGCENIS